jgi:hypothetical protein
MTTCCACIKDVKCAVGLSITHRRQIIGKLSGISASHAAHVARIFDHSALHAKTHAKERHRLFARPLTRRNFAFHTAHTKAAWHKHAVGRRQLLPCFVIGKWIVFAVVGLKVLGTYPLNQQYDNASNAHTTLICNRREQ